MILDAENRSETIKKEITIEAKEEAHKMRSEVEREVRERRAEIQRSEKRLIQKEEAIDRKTENLEKKEEGITNKEQTLIEKQHELDGFISKQIEELERISGYTVEEAKNILLSNIEKEIRYEASVMIKDIESKAKEEADKKAKEQIDKLNSADFLRWKSFYLGKVDVRLNPDSVSIGEVALSDFFARSRAVRIATGS